MDEDQIPSVTRVAPPAPPVLPQPPPGMPMMVMPPPMYPASIGGYAIPTASDRTSGMLCHLLLILTGLLGPLILWLVKKDESAFVNHHGREALNFLLTKFVVVVVLFVLTFVLMFAGGIGIVFIPLIFIAMIGALIAEIMACMAANRGEWYRYPCCIRIF